MLESLLCGALSGLFFFILHVTGTGSFPRALRPAQEQACLKRLMEGDAAARDELIAHNLRLVAHIIKKYYAGASDQEDLISIGTIGLIKAVNTFDPKKGIRLSSYAARCIENEILMSFRSAKKSAQDVSINEPIESGKDGSALTLVDVLADDSNLSEELDRKVKLQELYTLLKKLPAREEEILRLRYGLGGRRPQTQREVAEKLGISRSYVSRIEKKALEAMRRAYAGWEDAR